MSAIQGEDRKAKLNHYANLVEEGIPVDNQALAAFLRDVAEHGCSGEDRVVKQLNALRVVAGSHYHGGYDELQQQVLDAIDEAEAALTQPGSGEGEECERPEIPRDYWREVPCGHPPDPVAMYNPEGLPVCHCGLILDAATASPETVPGAPGPIVYCQQCGCHVAVPPQPNHGSVEKPECERCGGRGGDPECPGDPCPVCGGSGEKPERCPTCKSRNPLFTKCMDRAVAEEEGHEVPDLRRTCTDPWHQQPAGEKPVESEEGR